MRSQEIGANAQMQTVSGLPRRRTSKASDAPIGAGHRSGVDPSALARSDNQSREADLHLSTAVLVPSAAPYYPIGEGQLVPEGQTGCALFDLDRTVFQLRDLQRQRRFAITSQSRSDRSMESFLARVIGFDVNDTEKARKAIYARAKSFRLMVERSGPGQMGTDLQATPARSNQVGGEGQGAAGDHHGQALAACTGMVLASAQARSVWDSLRQQVEKDMVALAKTLPCYSYVRTVAGLGDLGLGIIIGETGNLSDYATKERVWKRLGLAVINGSAQRRAAGAEGIEQGYSPGRRAQVWAQCSDSMFKHQWRGDKDEDGKNPLKSRTPVVTPARAIGPYGEVYGQRKRHVIERNEQGLYAERVAKIVDALKRKGSAIPPENAAGRLTKMHIHNDATRVMTKALIENLWRVWNGKTPIPPAEHGSPRLDAAA